MLLLDTDDIGTANIPFLNFSIIINSTNYEFNKFDKLYLFKRKPHHYIKHDNIVKKRVLKKNVEVQSSEIKTSTAFETAQEICICYLSSPSI